MRTRRFEWEGAAETAAALRSWAAESAPAVDVRPIEREVIDGGDATLLQLTALYDATERAPTALRVEPGEAEAALAAVDAGAARGAGAGGGQRARGRRGPDPRRDPVAASAGADREQSAKSR